MKRIICLILMISLAVTITGSSFAEPVNHNTVTKISDDFDLNLISRKIVRLGTNNKITPNSDKENNFLEVHLHAKNNVKHEELNLYEAKGKVCLNGENFKLYADGELYIANLSNGNTFYEGKLHGDLKDSNNRIVDDVVLSIQYSENSNEALASLTIGKYTKDGKTPTVIDFGTISKEDNNIYFREIENKNKNLRIQNSTQPMLSMETTQDISIQSVSDDDILQATSKYSSIVGNLMYTSLFHADSTEKGLNNLFYLKVWSDSDEVEDYYDYYKGPGETVLFGTCTFNDIYYYIQHDDYWDCTNNPYPEDEKTTATFYLPVWLGSIIGTQVYTKELSLSSVDFTRSGSPYCDRGRWDLYKSGGFDVTETDALSTTPWDDDNEKGLSGRVAFYYTKTDSKVTNVQGYAKIYYYLLVEETDGLIYCRDVIISDSLSSSIQVN